ncbi:preprotein translocase subunit YajC [Mycoplasmatota bacterium WC44]
MEFLLYFLASLVFIFVLYVIFTFVSVKKQQKKLVNVQEEIKPNREVIISGGIYGKIKYLDSNIAKIEIADGVVIKVERYAIKQVL